MKHLKTALCLSALLAAPAYAGAPSSPVTYAPAQESWSWTGWYAGVQVGGAFNPGDNGELELDGPGVRDGNFGDYFAAFDDNYDGDFNNSFIGGIFAGYDHQFGRFVLGGLIDANFADFSQRQSGYSTTPAFYHEDRSVDFMATGRIRLGYAISDRVLAYVTGGVIFANTDYEMNTNTPATVATRGGDSHEWGYVVGLGVEGRLTRNISLGLEYLYTNLGKSDFRSNYSGVPAFSPLGVGSTDARGADRDFDFHMVQAKLTYRF